MTFLEIAARNERAHEKTEALLAEQVRVMAGYRDELEDRVAIAVEMLAVARRGSKDYAAQQVDDAYEALQAARKVAVT